MGTIYNHEPSKLLDWAKKHLNIKELAAGARKALHVFVAEEDFELVSCKPNGSTYHIEVRSKEDLTKNSLTLKGLFKEAHLESFGSWVRLLDGEIVWSFDLYLRYKNWDMGSNGIMLLNVKVTESGTEVFWVGE